MKMKPILGIVTIAATIGIGGAYAQTKEQACEELASRKKYPIAMRTQCQNNLTPKCKRLIDQWLATAAIEKRRCIRTPKGDLE